MNPLRHQTYYHLVLAFVVIVSSSSQILAQCSCTSKSVQEEREIATEIFIGRVLSKEINSMDIGHVDPGSRGTLGGISNAIEVVRVFKGEFVKNDTVRILTGDITNHCSYSFNLNQYYLIYSRYHFTNKCRRTKAVKSINDEDIQVLLDSNSPEFGPPYMSRDRSALNEKTYFRYRVRFPMIIPKGCKDYGSSKDCSQAISKEVSTYFYNNISQRDIKQVIVLRVYETGEIEVDEIIPKIGNLTQEEGREVLTYIVEKNYEFVTKGYGELMSSGITYIILSNKIE